MLLDYFGLTEEPFGVTPDSRFLYMSRQHREALASLVYGTNSNRGFLALIAKPGMGKTSLLYKYLEDLRGKARTAFVFRTDCDSREFIRHILIDLGIDPAGKDLPTMHDTLNRILIEETNAGRRFVLVIDEAQNLEESVLESIRLLSNFETPWMKLMQIVIAGQPTLAEKLRRPTMAQLRQRISLLIRLDPFDVNDVDAYIDHRLLMAGCKNPGLFTFGARRMIAEHSGGIPRIINNICFNAMSLACALKRKTIDRAALREVLADLDFDSLTERPTSDTGARETCAVRTRSSTKCLAATQNKARLRHLALGPALCCSVMLLAAPSMSKGRRAINSTRKIDGQTVPLPLDGKIATELSRGSVRVSAYPVCISKGQTLYQVSVDTLGQYDQQVLAQIHRLNPWLSDPNRVRAGQEVVMPLPAPAWANQQSETNQKAVAVSQEVRKE